MRNYYLMKSSMNLSSSTNFSSSTLVLYFQTFYPKKLLHAVTLKIVESFVNLARFQTFFRFKRRQKSDIGHQKCKNMSFFCPLFVPWKPLKCRFYVSIYDVFLYRIMYAFCTPLRALLDHLFVLKMTLFCCYMRFIDTLRRIL